MILCYPRIRMNKNEYTPTANKYWQNIFSEYIHDVNNMFINKRWRLYWSMVALIIGLWWRLYWSMVVLINGLWTQVLIIRRKWSMAWVIVGYNGLLIINSKLWYAFINIKGECHSQTTGHSFIAAIRTSNTTGATSDVGTAYPSGAHGLIILLDL